MILRSDNFYLFLIVSSVASSIIFCVGFFPYTNLKEVKDEAANGEIKSSRNVLMIIDALRLDFIESDSFSYLHKLIEQKEACLLKLQVSLPTVTKPRIKAITSGTIPSFLDVAMNFGDDEMKTDTFLHQLRARNEKIVFAGDETWKMFPLFEREYVNKDSLFVNDFYEGDRNVTETLKIELKHQDWKLLILHYLGLDHIGHVEGPFSRLVPPKLKEMDDVIQTIHEALKAMNEKTVLYVTGDHGMRDSGGHSGNSFAETHIPLLVIGDGHCESNNEHFYKQTDFAATFSVINGLPIPASSIGSIIPEMLMNISQLQRLDTYRMVNERLLKMMGSEGNDVLKFKLEKAKTYHKMFAYDATNKNAYEQAVSNYLTSSRGMSDLLAQLSLEVDLFQVLLGLFFNLLITITILLPCDDLLKDLKLSAKSFAVYIVISLAIKLLVINEVFDQANDLKSFVTLFVASSLLRIVIGIFNAKSERFKWFRLFDHDLLYMLILGHFFFVISVGSSSFVEEEHQIWYYFCNALFAFFTFHDYRGRTKLKSFFTVTFKCFTFLLLHIVIRRINQTGDKWISVPDLGDWFHSEAHQFYLHAFVVLSLVASAVWIVLVHCTKNHLVPFILIGNILLYFHHTRTINFRNDLPVTTLFWINLGAFVAIDLITDIKTKTKKFNFFIPFFFVSSLLHQPQNVILPLSCAVTCWFFNQACNRMVKNSKERVVAKIILHFWAGKLFYFYQGNSNGLSTIDVNAGFVGQMHVHLPIVFVFSVINTFNGQLISLFLLVNHLMEDSRKLMDDSGVIKKLLFKWISFLTIIPTTVFLIVITLLRHHLFIWSVFSPKLLYDVAGSVLMIIIMLIVKLAIKL